MTMMKVSELRVVLDDLQVIYAAAGAKSQAGDVKSVLDLFDGFDDVDVDAFLAELREEISPSTESVDVTPGRADVVESFVRRLLQAGTDRAAFEAVWSELACHSSVTKSEMDSIAHRFTGGRRSWGTRKLAHDAIKVRFVERSYQAGKMKLLEKFTPW